MVHQRWKDALFFLVQPPLRVLGQWVRLTWGWRSHPYPLRLHLGCGDQYLPMFVNVDANLLRKADLWLDLRNPLPFPDGIAEGIYAQETLEHFYPDECGRLLRECFRVLRSGGFIRLGVPHLRNAVEAYLQGKASWFPDWPRPYQSLGGRLSNFLLCDGQHRNAFDFSVLEELLKKCGFTAVQECPPGKSRWLEPEVTARLEITADQRQPPSSLYVEARKP